MTFHELELTIDSRDVDGHNQCRPSAILGILQESAIQASVALHVSREELLERQNLFWMVVRMWYRLERPLRWNETVRVRTSHRGGKGAMIYRDFDLFVGDEFVGEAVSLWVLANFSTRKLARISDFEAFTGTTGGELSKTKTLSKLRFDDVQPAGTRALHYSDTDINGHVNNTRYADFACDALMLHERPADAFVREMQIAYLAECKPGESMELFKGEGADGYYVHGSVDGIMRFEARIAP